ncbi:MAG TPA: hypothetical protein DDY13_05915 [Cytophagales bacterium]|jgi:hypothetical protein|nr:hypothetical protein [Cytophagales bacterium]
MKKLLFFTILIIGFSACRWDERIVRGNGNRISDTIQLNKLHALAIGGNYKITLKKSFQPKVIIHCDENLLEHIITEDRDGDLSITSNANLVSEKDIRIDIFFQNLERIQTFGASTVSSDDQIEGNDFKLNVAGVGATKLDIDVQFLEVDMSGAGVVELKGFAKEAVVSISGAGALNGYELEVDRCNIDISGVGGAEIYVTDYLEGNINGIGSINYRGQPKKIVRNIQGLGKIEESEEYMGQ